MTQTHERSRNAGIIDNRLLNFFSKTNLVGWWDFSLLGATLANTDPIAAVPDINGTGHGFAQATAGQRPTLEKPGLNGLSVGLWDTTPDDRFTLDSNISLGTTHTSFVVLKTPSAWVNQTIWGEDAANHSGLLYGGTQWYEAHATQVAVNHGLSLNTWYTLLLTRNGTSFSLYVNGNSALTNTGVGTGNFTLTFFGARHATLEPLKGIRVAEAGVFNTVLSAGNIESVQKYLRAKWVHY